MYKQLNALQNISKADHKINYDSVWEQSLHKKLRKIVLVALANVIPVYILFQLINYHLFDNEMLFAIGSMAIGFMLLQYFRFIVTVYWFYISTLLFFIAINLKAGSDSYAFLHFFPFVISLIQMLGRKELLKHLYIICGIIIVGAGLMIIGFQYDFNKAFLSEDILSYLRPINIITSGLTTLTFSLILVLENIRQQKRLEKALDDKSILLAEVFHRVKNNLNIVNSLLNLKKNSTESLEVKNAMEECRTRVFAMSLVHQNIHTKEASHISFDSYARELVKEIRDSFRAKIPVNISMNLSPLKVHIDRMIPMGLIINEVLTTLGTHAANLNESLDLKIKLIESDNVLVLTITNLNRSKEFQEIDCSSCLGIDLIDSLVDQIDGEHQFNYANNIEFTLKLNKID